MSDSKVWIVGENYLDGGPESDALPVAAFSSEEAARSFGMKLAEPQMGTSHWWGTVTNPDSCFEIWELEVDADA